MRQVIVNAALVLASAQQSVTAQVTFSAARFTPHNPTQMSLLVQTTGVLGAGLAVLLFAHQGPSGHAVAWGSLSGIGGALGNVALYRGLVAGVRRSGRRRFWTAVRCVG